MAKKAKRKSNNPDGRPPKPASEAKSQIIMVRCTIADKAAIRDQAAKANMSVSAWMIHRALLP